MCIPVSLGESFTVLIFQIGTRSDCSNHRWINVILTVTKVSAPIILRFARATSTNNMPDFAQVEDASTRQLLEMDYLHRHPTIAVLLDGKVPLIQSIEQCYSVLFAGTARQRSPLTFCEHYTPTPLTAQRHTVIVYSKRRVVFDEYPICLVLFEFVSNNVMEGL